MTMTEGETLKVTQADRDAAATLIRQVEHRTEYLTEIEDGFYDENFFVQAFARHRIAAIRASPPPGNREAVLEEAASDEMVEALAEEFCLAGFSEGVQAVLRQDDPSYWSKVTPEAQERYRRGVRAIIRALKSTEPLTIGEDGWQPIETAPKDGAPVRLFDPEYCDEEMNPSLEGHWSDGTHDGAGGFQAAVWNNTQDYFATVDVKPTHWRPLPDPPAALRNQSPDREEG